MQDVMQAEVLSIRGSEMLFMPSHTSIIIFYLLKGFFFFFFFFFFFLRYNRQKPTAFVANAIFLSSPTKINSANKLLQTHETFRLKSHPVVLGMQTILRDKIHVRRLED